VFSGSVTNFTLIPYFLVKFEASDCITIMSLLFTVAMVIVVWAACAVGLPLLTPTNTASPQRRAPLATTAKRGKCMLTPFIGW
jgi:hypothetical protein